MVKILIACLRWVARHRPAPPTAESRAHAELNLFLSAG